jgi:hypothetical protein
MPFPSHLRRLIAAAALGLGALALAPSAALADAGLSLDRFNPAPAGDRTFGITSPEISEGVTFESAILFDYAHNPYTLTHGPGQVDVGAVVSDQLFMHVSATVALFGRASLSFNIPVAVLQDGDDPVRGGVEHTSPHGAGFGDTRLSFKVKLYGHNDGAFQASIGGSLWIPVGDTGTFVSDEKVRGMPEIILGGHGKSFAWSFAAGPELRPSVAFGDAIQGSALRIGGAFGALVGQEKRLTLGPEVATAIVLEDVGLRTMNAELLLGARYRVTDALNLALAAGPGLTSGLGTPDIRVAFGLGYSLRGEDPAKGAAAADRRAP